MTAESGRREAELTFEGAIKGSLRLVAHLTCDLHHAVAGGCEELRADLKPPVREIGSASIIDEISTIYVLGVAVAYTLRP